MSWIIYGDKGSGAFSAEAALAEAEAPYEFREISLERNEQREPAFLAVNPSGKMPAVRLPEGGIVTESLAILLTVAEHYPAAGLLPPPGTFARAQVFRWLAFMSSEIYPMVEISDYPARFVPEGAESDALRDNAGERIRARLAIVEQAVAGPWLLADGFSAADIYAAMFSVWTEARKADVPKLRALARAVAQRPRIATIWNRHFPPRG
ncbi:MAG TPA: glutathione S-transferase family protein [Rhizomicrobium sp.]